MKQDGLLLLECSSTHVEGLKKYGGAVIDASHGPFLFKNGEHEATTVSEDMVHELVATNVIKTSAAASIVDTIVLIEDIIDLHDGSCEISVSRLCGMRPHNQHTWMAHWHVCVDVSFQFFHRTSNCLPLKI